MDELERMMKLLFALLLMLPLLAMAEESTVYPKECTFEKEGTKVTLYLKKADDKIASYKTYDAIKFQYLPVTLPAGLWPRKQDLNKHFPDEFAEGPIVEVYKTDTGEKYVLLVAGFSWENGIWFDYHRSVINCASLD